VSDRIDHLDIGGEGRDLLVAALGLAMDPWPSTGSREGVNGWRVSEDVRPWRDQLRDGEKIGTPLPGLVYGNQGPGYGSEFTPFPVTISDPGIIATLSLSWLEGEWVGQGRDRRHVSRYPQAPDTDGSTNMGWRVSLDSASHVVVAPHWVVYGK
jgi:hypothetical protein